MAQRRLRHSLAAGIMTVAAIELGDGAPSPAGVYGLTIDHNALTGGMGDAQSTRTPGRTVTGVVLADNLVTGTAHWGPWPLRTHRVPIVLGAPQLLPRAYLAPSPGLDASADPLVWCAPYRPGRPMAASLPPTPAARPNGRWRCLAMPGRG